VKTHLITDGCTAFYLMKTRKIITEAQRKRLESLEKRLKKIGFELQDQRWPFGAEKIFMAAEHLNDLLRNS